MFNWLSNLWHIITGDIKAVIRWITTAITAVYSFIDRQIHALWSGLALLSRYLSELEKAAWNYISQLWTYARWIVEVVIAGVIHWADAAINFVLKYAQGVWQILVASFDYLKNLILRLINDAITWVIRNIYDPLVKWLTDAWHWITHEGAFVYYLLTHLDKLASLLAGWLWHEWLNLFGRYGRTVARWLISHMLGLAKPLIDVLETIVAAIL